MKILPFLLFSLYLFLYNLFFFLLLFSTQSGREISTIMNSHLLCFNRKRRDRGEKGEKVKVYWLGFGEKKELGKAK